LLRRTLESQLVEAGYDVRVTASGDDAVELARTTPIGTFLVDVTMPE
jgi:DNA-binding response OmpR family regulator